ncbi:hypothetical protein SODALDRAFT_322721 [Sodiomyces alkalinus F11]|uniref:Uncharacterized protein n=1 Tax=Sodiomyces alkalinus (strain CBS 110278 / VKM F-3762 / F11) TaxID=1314773 RepID=A0A3N2Q4C7_SODAK|nr:hypothetical protein SODALDRAFT_322721 [Sodiomyces alkalinus F11]ROT41633.1 hypothetical protein SODALDRAFT_322721 [Sodiomyces alkalinus F11]
MSDLGLDPSQFIARPYSAQPPSKSDADTLHEQAAAGDVIHTTETEMENETETETETGSRRTQYTFYSTQTNHKNSSFEGTVSVTAQGIKIHSGTATSACHPPQSALTDQTSASTAAQMIRRLAQQNSRLRETWEAERKYLEANRERVEEVYKEERALMEEERCLWDAEKTTMVKEIRLLRERVLELESDNLRLQTALAQQRPRQHHLPEQKAAKAKIASVTTFVASVTSVSGPRTKGGGEGSTGFYPPSHTTLVPASDRRFNTNISRTDDEDGARRSDLAVDSASASDTFPRPTTTSIRRSTDSTLLFNKPHVPQRPRFLSAPASSSLYPPRRPQPPSFFMPGNAPMHPQSSASPQVDFLGSPRDEDVPVIDIQAIHPELEGISLRAPAVQKETFTDSSTDSSNDPSAHPSPLDNGNGDGDGDGDGDSNGSDATMSRRRRSSKRQTLEVLSVPEPARLVMHAGHTPSHSLTHLPSAIVSDAATINGESGTSTPREDPAARGGAMAKLGRTQKRLALPRRIEDTLSFELEASAEDHPEPRFEPDEGDRELKGPLMVKNIPAQDEIFFRRLSEKLEDVSRGQDATPSCMQNGEEAYEEDGAAASSKEPGNGEEGLNGAQERGSGSDSLSEDEEGVKDVPLKLKRSNNFGAPLGAIH